MEKKKKKFKKAVLLLFPLLIIYYLSSIYFVKEICYYNSSKSFMTYVVYASIILTALFMVIFTIRGFKCIKKNKTKSYVWYFIFIIIFIICELFASINISKISNSLSKITNKEAGYSTSLVTLSSSKINKINDLDDENLIGMISDTNNVEGYKLPMEIVKSKKIDKKSIVSYDDFTSMLKDLYNKK